MESSLISGPVMSVIGITTVFVVLVSLVSVVALMGRWFGQFEVAVPTAQNTASDRQPHAEVAPDEQLDVDLLGVALAAYAYHRSRGPSATAPAQTTEWSSAGRIRQIAAFRR